TDVFINPTARSLWWSFPEEISFTKHILPIFQQFSDAQWVNYGFSVQFGYSAPFDFTNKVFLKKLSQIIPCQPANELKKDIYQEFRRQIYDQFRLPTQTEPKFQPDPNSPTVQLWPWMYGDTVQLGGAPQDANQYLCLTNTQLMMLEKWVEGDFTDDLELPEDDSTHVDISTLYHHTHSTLEQYPTAEQPLELDRAAMHFCLGGAFHPGCEMTWPMRHATMYRAPFRIRPRTDNNPESNYGVQLSHKEVMDDNGPLYFNAPGDITRWMAVPWQTDTSSCRSGYIPKYDPFLPTFWPARVPNHVLTQQDYETVMDPKKSKQERLEAFNRRAVWLRGLPGEYLDQIREMITEFGKLGIVEKREGPKDPDFPDVIYVESGVGYEEPESLLNNLLCEYIPSANEARYWRERQERLGGG
ncbi:LodA/GoxA family CTQ-dependent oxidase, partial [Leptolyngbya cf. ectocarpi LEGE 11479]